MPDESGARFWRPPVRLAHVADEYQRMGGLHDGSDKCTCGPCCAASLRRALHPRVRVIDGLTVLPRGEASP